jgi:hypothetical protein
MPSIETWQQATNFTEDLKFNSTLLQNRQHHPNGQKLLMFVLEIISTMLFFYDRILSHKLKEIYHYQ